MNRDTAVLIENEDLYNKYTELRQEIIHSNQEVINANDASFPKYFNTYKHAHRLTQGKNIRTTIGKAATRSAKDIYLSWMDDEQSQILPVFIWERYMSPNEEELFYQKVIPILDQDDIDPIADLNLWGYHVSRFKGQVYFKGDIILSTNISGEQVEFMSADLVVFSQDRWWLCSLSGNEIKTPFELNPSMKRAIRNKSRIWFRQGKSYLNSRDLRDLLKDAAMIR